MKIPELYAKLAISFSSAHDFLCARSAPPSGEDSRQVSLRFRFQRGNCRAAAVTERQRDGIQ